MSATTPKTFRSYTQLMGDFASECHNDEIKSEPMFFNSDFDFAYREGGRITRSFLGSLPKGWQTDVVFDSRVHMLMPGWYPAIPGWHHDDVPRPAIPTGQHFITAGQPDYEHPRYRAEHIMGLVNADVCPTQFLEGVFDMPAIPEGQLIYREWDAVIRKAITDGDIKPIEAPDRKLIYFNCDTFHTGIQARSNGWRWFGRISRNTERTKTITNEIRAQVQVYLEFPMEGW